MQLERQTEGRDETDTSSDAPRRMDRAVRAALSRRASEPRSFGNEDDMEGPRPAGGQAG